MSLTKDGMRVIKKKLNAKFFGNFREVVSYVNELELQKEDIMSILPEGENIILFYYA